MVILPTPPLMPYNLLMFLIFSLLKQPLGRKKYVAMSKSNYMEPNEINLIGWVDQALDRSITKQNIRFGFRVTCIYPLNPTAMDNKIGPSNIYIMVSK
jgi:hypothetical protein